MTGYEIIMQSVLRLRDLELRGQVDFDACSYMAHLLKHARRAYIPGQCNRASKAFEVLLIEVQRKYNTFASETSREQRILNYSKRPKAAR